MAAIIFQGFNVDSTEPIDSRNIADTLVDRNAISPGILYEGLLVYVVETQLVYALTDLSNANNSAGWTVIGSGSGGGGTDLAGHSVTELDDVSSAGSGEIITNAERALVNTISGKLDVSQYDTDEAAQNAVIDGKLDRDLQNVPSNLTDAETLLFRNAINAIKVDFDNNNNEGILLWIGTEAEYDALPDSQKDDPNIIQYITDDVVEGDTGSGGGGASILNQLGDVTITNVANGNVLTYDSATSMWINTAPSPSGSTIEVQGAGVDKGSATCLNFTGPGVTVSDVDMDGKINININANALSATYALSQNLINEAQGLTQVYTITLSATSGFTATFDDVVYNMTGFIITRVDADTLTIQQDPVTTPVIDQYMIDPMVTVTQDSTSTEVVVTTQTLIFNVNAPAYTLSPSFWSSQTIGVGGAQTFTANVEAGFDIRFLRPPTANPTNFTATVPSNQNSIVIAQDSNDLRTSAGSTVFNPEVEINLTGSSNRTGYASRSLTLSVTEPTATVSGDITPNNDRGSLTIENYTITGVSQGYTAAWGALPSVSNFSITESSGTISIQQDGSTTFPSVGNHSITIPYTVTLNTDSSVVFNRSVTITYRVDALDFRSGAVAFTLGQPIIDPTGPDDAAVVNDATYLSPTPSGFSITKPGAEGDPFYYYFFTDTSVNISEVTTGGQPATYVDINSANDLYRIYRSPLFYSGSGTQVITLLYS